LSRDAEQSVLKTHLRGCRRNLIHRQLTQGTSGHRRQHQGLRGLMRFVVRVRSNRRGRRGRWCGILRQQRGSKQSRSR
jgi:hypothetical protein